MTDRPRLVCIPSADAEFARHAAELYEGLEPDLGPDRLAADLGRLLHARYPAAVVRPREAIASVVPGDDVLYVLNRAYGSRLSASVEIAIPIDEVFRTYVERVDDWQTAIDVHPVVLDAGLVGSVYAARYELFGRSINGRIRIVAADPPRWIRFEARGAGIEAWYITSFAETPRGTVIHVVGDYDLPDGLLPRLADRLGVEGLIRSQIESAHESLRRLCEEGEPDPRLPPVPDRTPVRR